MYEYKFRTVQAGQFDDACAVEAADDFSVEHFVKDGNHFYILFSKYAYGDDEDPELSDADQIWKEVGDLDGRLATVEGALALKIKKDSIDPAPKVETPAVE